MSATCMQLRIDGGEDPFPLTRTRALTMAQREILRWVGHHREIRPVEAGAIVHAHRTPPCERRLGLSRSGQGCCQYASTDGWDALNRLRKRGILEPVGDGRWRIAVVP